MANNPSGDGTLVDAPLEWLAFRGMPLLPSFPRRSRIITTGVVGRGDDMTFTWPLWSQNAEYCQPATVVMPYCCFRRVIASRIAPGRSW